MISQNSNNKPSGSTAIQCDAGIPVMGRTADTGVYQILKVNADGSLPAPSMVIPTTVDLSTPNSTALAPVGAFAAGVIMAYNQTIFGGFRVTITTAGVYVIRPFFMFQYVVLGSVSMFLVKANSQLDFYTMSRNIGTDAFNPSITDVQTGLAAEWHNIANQQIGGSQIAKTLFNNNQPFEYYLETGEYKLLVVSHTAPTTGSATVYAGYETFYQKS